MKQIFLANQTLRIQRILKPQGSKKNLIGMKKYGIRFNKAYGVKIPIIRELAKKFKPNHDLALYLWDTKIHELMLLAIFIDDYRQVTEFQMNKWVRDFASWDICDQCCSNLFDKTPYAFDKIFEWSKSKDEFIKRAGFALIATMAIHNKKLDHFLTFADNIKKRYLQDHKLTDTDKVILNERAKDLHISDVIAKKIEYVSAI